MIGRAVCAPIRLKGANMSILGGLWGSKSSMDMACEQVALLRHLLMMPGWKDCVNVELIFALSLLSTAVEDLLVLENMSSSNESLARTQHIWMLLAALCVLGGQTETLREGARVKLLHRGVSVEGTLIYFKPGDFAYYLAEMISLLLFFRNAKSFTSTSVQFG